MKIKKTLRFIALIFMICLVCVLPFPLKLAYKDNLPKNLIENVETNDQDDEKDILREVF